MFSFITKRSFLFNLLAAIVLLAIILIVFFSSLSFLTSHGESAKVPSVIGKPYAEAVRMLEQQGFTVAVQDSIYIDSLPPLAVIKQTPEEDEVVKEHRTIFLTVNRKMPPMVEMPDLRGFSLRSAELYLQTIGLKLGDTSFVPDIAKNAVKQQLYNGIDIEPGGKIPMGSRVDFILGSGVGDNEFNVPDLTGLTYSEAINVLNAKAIGLGALIVVDGVKDTAAAFVVKQNPELSTTIEGQRYINRIRSGQMIDLYISINPPIDSLGNVSADTSSLK